MADVLLLTPLMPYPTGHGSAMRASMAVEVLAERHQVFLVSTELWGTRILPSNWIRRHTAGYAKFPAATAPGEPVRLLESAFPGRSFSAIYVFRLSMATLALQLQAAMDKSRMILDLDDDEVERAQRFMPLRLESGDHQRAELERAELARLMVYRKIFLPRFETILLAAEKDQRRLQAEFPSQRFLHLLNAVRTPILSSPAPVKGRLLFVGTLDYLPNEDGLVHFCHEVMPLLRASTAGCRLRVVGASAPPRVRALAGPDVHLAGFVPDLAPEYAAAQVAIVPLRAGSGTRVKILEAFSYGCPVVSTAAGAEGLGLSSEEHYLLADTPQGFASACDRLLADAELRSRLVGQASDWLKRNHSIECVRSVLHPLLEARSGCTPSLV